jgi:hypothetical protein
MKATPISSPTTSPRRGAPQPSQQGSPADLFKTAREGPKRARFSFQILIAFGMDFEREAKIRGCPSSCKFTLISLRFRLGVQF